MITFSSSVGKQYSSNNWIIVESCVNNMFVHKRSHSSLLIGTTDWGEIFVLDSLYICAEDNVLEVETVVFTDVDVGEVVIDDVVRATVDMLLTCCCCCCWLESVEINLEEPINFG